MARSIVVIAHNLRSAHNVGSLLRTAEGLGVEKVYFTGYTPYPHQSGDPRLPYLANKISKQIQKTALGAEISQGWQQVSDIAELITTLRQDGYQVAALEQTPQAIPLPGYKPPQKLAVILGREVEGVESAVLDLTDLQLEIPMAGQKESFNVVQAAAIAIYHCHFMA